MNASAFYHPERVRELSVEIIDMKVISTLEGLKDEHDRDFIVAQIELFNKWVPIYINDIKEALFFERLPRSAGSSAQPTSFRWSARRTTTLPGVPEL